MSYLILYVCSGNIGTVHWTAPEVLNCARYHFAADVYGLGMVIYEIITRTLPFSALPVPAVIVAVLLRREKPKIPPECNRELTQLVTRLTIRNTGIICVTVHV